MRKFLNTLYVLNKDAYLSLEATRSPRWKSSTRW